MKLTFEIHPVTHFNYISYITVGVGILYCEEVPKCMSSYLKFKLPYVPVWITFPESFTGLLVFKMEWPTTCFLFVCFGFCIVHKINIKITN